jgi:hypothetical protein
MQFAPSVVPEACAPHCVCHQTDAVAAGKKQCDEFTKEESLVMAGIVDEVLSQLGVSYPPQATSA